MKNSDICVTFSYRNDIIRIHKASIAALGHPEYIRLLINKKGRQLAVQPCGAEERDKIQVPWLSDEDSRSIEFHGMAFLEVVTDIMGWEKGLTYRVKGECIERPAGRYILFNLDRAETPDSWVKEQPEEGPVVALFSKDGLLDDCAGIVFDMEKHCIGINGLTLEALGRPDRIQMLVNQKTGEMILRTTAQMEKDSYRIPAEVYERGAVYGIEGEILISMIYQMMGWKGRQIYAVDGGMTASGVLFPMKEAVSVEGWERKVITEEYGLI